MNPLSLSGMNVDRAKRHVVATNGLSLMQEFSRLGIRGTERLVNIKSLSGIEVK